MPAIDVAVFPVKDPVPVVYGPAIISGRVVALESRPDFVRVVLVLGEGPFKGIRLHDGKPAIFIGGEKVPQVEKDKDGKPVVKWYFYNGERGDFPLKTTITDENGQEVASFFSQTPSLSFGKEGFIPALSHTAYLVIELHPAPPNPENPGQPDPNIEPDDPRIIDWRRALNIQPNKVNVFGLYDGLKVNIYDETGALINLGGRVYTTQDLVDQGLWPDEDSVPLEYRNPGTNPAWCLVDLLLNPRYGLGQSPDRIDWPSVIDYARWCMTEIPADVVLEYEISRRVPHTFDTTISGDPETTWRGWWFRLKPGVQIQVNALGRLFDANSTATHAVELVQLDESDPDVIIEKVLASVSVDPNNPVRPISIPVVLKDADESGKPISYAVKVQEFGVDKVSKPRTVLNDTIDLVDPLIGGQTIPVFDPANNGGYVVTASGTGGVLIFKQPDGKMHDDPVMAFSLVSGTQQVLVPRMQQGAAFPELIDALNALNFLTDNQAASTIQFINGKFRIIHPPERPDPASPPGDGNYSEDTDLSTQPGLFEFTRDNIVSGTFVEQQPDARQLPNRWIGLYRNLDTEFIERDKTSLDRAELRRKAGGRVIEQEVRLGNMNTSQAIRTLNKKLQENVDLRSRFQFTGTPDTLDVLPGDVVLVTHEDFGFVKQPMEILSVVEQADLTRRFTARVYVPGVYEENAANIAKALQERFSTDFGVDVFSVPPQATNLSLRWEKIDLPAGNEIIVIGDFVLINPAVRARVWRRKYVNNTLEYDWTFFTEATGEFVDTSVERSLPHKGKTVEYEYKVQAMSAFGVVADFKAAPTARIEPGVTGGVPTPVGTLDPNLVLQLAGQIKTIGQWLSQLLNGSQIISRIRNLFSSLLASLGNPVLWLLFAVAGLLLFRIRTLKNHIVGELPGPIEVSEGEILVDEPAVEVVPGDVVWATAVYLKVRNDGPLALLKKVNGTVDLQVLIFDVDTRSVTWGASVRDVSDLPSSGSTAGEARIVKNTDEIYTWNGTTWTKLGNVIVRSSKEVAPRRFFNFLFTYSTAPVTVPSEAVEIHARVEVGSQGLSVPEGLSFAVSNFDLKFRRSGSGNPASPPSPAPETANDSFDEGYDPDLWHAVHLDNDGSIDRGSGTIIVNSGSGGDFSGTADTGSGLVFQLPDSQIPELGDDDEDVVVFDADFSINVTVVAMPPAGTTFLMLRESEDADAALVGLKLNEDGEVVIVYRQRKGMPIWQDTSSTPVSATDNVVFRVELDGAVLRWFYSTDGTVFTPLGGSLQNLVVDFPLEQFWLAAGHPEQGVAVEFDDFSYSATTPIEQPSVGPQIDSATPLLPLLGGGRVQNLIANPSGASQDAGWTVYNEAMAPDKYLGHPVFRIGPVTLGPNEELRSQTREADLTPGDRYILSAFVKWVKFQNVTGTLVVKAAFLSEDGIVLDEIVLDVTVNTPMLHKRLSADGTVPEGTVGLRFSVGAGPSGLTIPQGSEAKLWNLQFERAVGDWQTEPTLPENVIPTDIDVVNTRWLADDGDIARNANLVKNAGFTLGTDFWTVDVNATIEDGDEEHGRVLVIRPS